MNIIKAIIILFWWDILIDIVIKTLEYDILQPKNQEATIAAQILQEVPILTKEEIYKLIQNVDSEGIIDVDEKIYYKNQLLFEEVQKELDEEFFSQVENVPIKKRKN